MRAGPEQQGPKVQETRCKSGPKERQGCERLPSGRLRCCCCSLMPRAKACAEGAGALKACHCSAPPSAAEGVSGQPPLSAQMRLATSHGQPHGTGSARMHSCGGVHAACSPARDEAQAGRARTGTATDASPEGSSPGPASAAWNSSGYWYQPYLAGAPASVQQPGGASESARECTRGRGRQIRRTGARLQFVGLLHAQKGHAAAPLVRDCCGMRGGSAQGRVRPRARSLLERFPPPAAPNNHADPPSPPLCC